MTSDGITLKRREQRLGKRFGFHILLPLLVWGGVAVKGDSSGYLLLLKEGVERLEAGGGAAAQSLFEAASQADPRDPLSYLGRGCVALAGGDWREAAPFFRRAAASEAPPVGAVYGLGLCYLLAGQAESARPYFQEALERNPELSPAQTYRILLEILAGEYDSARQHLQLARSGGSDEEWLDFLQLLLDYRQGEWARIRAPNPIFPETGTAPPEPLLSHPPGWPQLPLRISFTESSELQWEWISSASLGEEMAPLAGPPAPSAPPPPTDRPYFQGLAPGQVVQGILFLRVRVPAAVQPDFVTLSVDGRCIGVTNAQPYGFRWNTTREADGPHTLTLRTEGETVLEYHLEAIVQNREPDPQPDYDPAICQRLDRRLTQALKVARPHYDAQEFRLHASLRSRRYEEALDLCEAVLARNWQRRDLLSLLLELYARNGSRRCREELAQPHHGVAGGKRVALTFDDGPNLPHTPQLLKLLDEYDASATFLVVGRRAEQNPSLLRAIAAHGHEIGNHSYSHRRMLQMDELDILSEVLHTEWIIRQAGLQPVRLFRPPGGHSSPPLRAALSRLGYTLVFWTINGGSFKHLSPGEAAQHMIDRTTDGTIFLLHNGPDNTLAVLPHLLRHLQARGFRCVTVSEILQPPADGPAEERLPAAD